MDRSIRKSIYVNELEYIFQLNSTSADKRSRLILELFENPQARKMYLLKDDIRTLSELETKIHIAIDQQNDVSAILNIFSVKDDLLIPVELTQVMFSNVKLAFFVGAGVSKLLKIPLWGEVAAQAIRYMNDNNHLNHTEAERLRIEKYTSKQIISIFHRRLKSKTEILKFYEQCLVSKDNEYGNPYELLFGFEEAIGKPILKLSTNIDLEWEKILKTESEKQMQNQDEKGKTTIPISYKKTQYKDFRNDQDLLSDVLYQIHGSMHDLDEAIITTSQYVNHYRDDKRLKGFLEKVFKEYIVLFLGSGMQEFEILEHCLKQSPFQHFALVGTQAGEENLFRMKKEYFSELHIKALPYYLDFQGYDRLLFLLKAWTDEIRAGRKKQYYDDIKLIDEVL